MVSGKRLKKDRLIWRVRFLTPVFHPDASLVGSIPSDVGTFSPWLAKTCKSWSTPQKTLIHRSLSLGSEQSIDTRSSLCASPSSSDRLTLPKSPSHRTLIGSNSTRSSIASIESPPHPGNANSQKQDPLLREFQVKEENLLNSNAIHHRSLVIRELSQNSVSHRTMNSIADVSKPRPNCPPKIRTFPPQNDAYRIEVLTPTNAVHRRTNLPISPKQDAP